jgi:hypothetical protein
MQHDPTTGEVGKAETYQAEKDKYDGLACEACERAQVIREQTKERVRKHREGRKLADMAGNGPGAAPTSPVTVRATGTPHSVTTQVSGPHNSADVGAAVTVASGPRSGAGNADYGLPYEVPRMWPTRAGEPAYAEDHRQEFASYIRAVIDDPKDYYIFPRDNFSFESKEEAKDFARLIKAFKKEYGNVVTFEGVLPQRWFFVYDKYHVYGPNYVAPKEDTDEETEKAPEEGIESKQTVTSVVAITNSGEKTDSTQARGEAKKLFAFMEKMLAQNADWSTTYFDNPKGTLSALEKIIKASGKNYKVVRRDDGSAYIGF